MYADCCICYLLVLDFLVMSDDFSDEMTGTLQCLQKKMATYRLICVLVARPRRCLTLSNPVP